MNDAGPEMLSIFCGALERLAADERAAYLEAACGQDAELRARIEALLQAHEAAGGFLPARDAGPAAAADIPAAPASPPSRKARGVHQPSRLRQVRGRHCENVTPNW